MKVTASYFLLLASVLVPGSFLRPGGGEQKLFSVKGRITQTHDYCGGAYMPELMEEGRRPAPFAHKTIYVKRGSKNELHEEIVDSATTDTSGHFELKLAPGKYCIIEQYKTEKLVIPQNNQFATFNADCIRMKWAACDFDLVVKDKDVDSVFFNYHQPCSYSQPCESYRGPLPPAAAH